MPDFRADVRQRGDTAILDLFGDVNGTAEAELQAAWATAVVSRPRAALLNFERVDYINSTGIALIVGLLAEARKADRAVLVCGLSDHFRHIFEITRLSDLMSFYPDEEAAVRGAGSSAATTPAPEPA